MLSVALHAFERIAHAFGNLAVDAVEQEFAETEDRVERRAQLVAHVGQELRLVPAGVLKAPVELLEALARRVDVLRERAEFVAVTHRDLLRKVSGCNTIEALVDLLHRHDDRPGYGVAQRQRQDEAREGERDDIDARRFVCGSACVDPVHHVRLGPIDELVRQSFEPVGERRQLGGLDLPRLADSSIAGQLQHAGGDGDETGIFLAKAAEQRNLVLRDKRHAVEVVAELVDLAKRAGQFALSGAASAEETP